MARKDFKDTRPLEELIEELFRRGQAEQKAIEEDPVPDPRRYSLRLQLAEFLKAAEDPFFELVEQAALSFPRDASLAASILARVKIPPQRLAEVRGWIKQLKVRLSSEADADLRTLLKAAITNLRRQAATKKDGSKSSKGPVKCR